MSYRRRRGLGGGRRGAGSDDDGRSSGPRQEGPGRAARWGAALLLVLLLSGTGYLLAAEWLFPGSRAVAEGDVVEVPDLVGLTVEEARRSLAASGLELTVASRVAHPRAPEGAVLAQSPLPNSFARPGAPVEATVSQGPERLRVPDLRGLTGRQGRLTLERLGFRVELDTAKSPVEKGRVVGTRPEKGTEVRMPSDVTLVVSEGPRVSRVPDVVGRHVDDVRDVLERAGFRLGEISYDPEAFAAPGRVIAQSPSAGYALRVGGRVSVKVAGERPARDSLPDLDTLPPEEGVRPAAGDTTLVSARRARPGREVLP